MKDHRWVLRTPPSAQPRRQHQPAAATFGLRHLRWWPGSVADRRTGRAVDEPDLARGAAAAARRGRRHGDLPRGGAGLDLVVNVGVESFSHLLVVKTPEAARRAEVIDLAMGLKTRGIVVREAGDGGWPRPTRRAAAGSSRRRRR